MDHHGGMPLCSQLVLRGYSALQKLLCCSLFRSKLEVNIHIALFCTLQYMAGGSLADLIQGNCLDETSIAYSLRELLRAIDYLHGENKIHRGNAEIVALEHPD